MRCPTSLAISQWLVLLTIAGVDREGKEARCKTNPRLTVPSSHHQPSPVTHQPLTQKCQRQRKDLMQAHHFPRYIPTRPTGKVHHRPLEVVRSRPPRRRNPRQDSRRPRLVLPQRSVHVRSHIARRNLPPPDCQSTHPSPCQTKLTAFTQIPSPAHSLLSAFVNCPTPPLLAAYAGTVIPP